MRISIVNINRCLLTAGLAGMLTLHSKAQPAEAEISHKVTAGTGTQVLNDGLLSLTSEKLTSTGLTYSFISSSTFYKKSIMAGFAKGTGSPGKNGVKSNEFRVQYTSAFSVFKNKEGKWDNYTGYSLVINPQYIQSGDQYSWATTGSAALYNSLVYSWKRSTVSFDLTVPLAGFTSRPSENTVYKGSINDMLYNGFSNLAFASLHNLKGADISLQYQGAITGKLRFESGVSYSYKKLSSRSNFLQQAFMFQAGLSYIIK